MEGRKPDITGTSPSDIAARLNSRYGNLNARSSRDVTVIGHKRNPFLAMPQTEMEKQVEREVQEKMEKEMAERQKRKKNTYLEGRLELSAKMELLTMNKENSPDLKTPKRCICKRPSKSFKCGGCLKFFKGRIADTCPRHPTETFLMDFRMCPYCSGPVDMIKQQDQEEA
ncbi:uncharacterized protein CG13380-like [Drosophila bipectinata]|uniref:uncharacterized protein CG13380-like n=1 Tax=Drosophila bipectinata TaxID=42026 RepID=UPI001C8ACB39|nr:uncharacterized protein CG13380-like [Drosophila bipectinata]